jgi:polar amino acid transport system substrate-binding protein
MGARRFRATPLSPGIGAFAALLLIAFASPPAWTQEGGRVLRVGVVDGAHPCTFREDGVWKGLAVDLWNRVATEEKLPFILEDWPNLRTLLQATRDNKVDVAVGCINLSPERIATTGFSLPFQEDGLAVLAVQSPLDLGRAFLRSLLRPPLLLLLGGFLLSIGVLSLLTWRVEDHSSSSDTMRTGSLRSFARIFQILATGPGSNTIVETTRGHGLVLLAYLVRIVSASLLVGYLTVHVVEETRRRSAESLTSLEDLRGRRVAVRPGSISATLLQEMNERAGSHPVQVVDMPRVDQAIPLVQQGKAEAVLADELQLSYAISRHPRSRAVPTLVLRGVRPESQGFAFSPLLPDTMALRIDLALSRLKRAGAVTQLREETLRPPAKQAIKD